MTEEFNASSPPGSRALPWEIVLVHLADPCVMAGRPEVHGFLRIGLDMLLANLNDVTRVSSHPYPSRGKLEAEIVRLGLGESLSLGKFNTFWTGGDAFRKDLAAYALAEARLGDLSAPAARELVQGVADVIAGTRLFSALVMQVTRLDDRLRLRTAQDFILQTAPLLDASCREDAQAFHRAAYMQNVQRWRDAFETVLESLAFDIEDGEVADLCSQLIGLADGLASRVARTGDGSYFFACDGTSLLGKTALQLFWSTVNSIGCGIAVLVDDEIRKRRPGGEGSAR